MQMNQESTLPQDEPVTDHTPSPQPGADGPTATQVRVRTVLATLIVVAILLMGTWRNYWAATDQGQYGRVLLGHYLSEGGQLYAHAMQDGMPGVLWLNALGYVLSGGHALGAWR